MFGGVIAQCPGSLATELSHQSTTLSELQGAETKAAFFALASDARITTIPAGPGNRQLLRSGVISVFTAHL